MTDTPDGPPPTMPEEARSRAGDAAEPVDHPAEGAGGVPAGTAPEVAAALGTSETMEPVDGVHTPDVGEGARDFDTGAAPRPGRSR